MYSTYLLSYVEMLGIMIQSKEYAGKSDLDNSNAKKNQGTSIPCLEHGYQGPNLEPSLERGSRAMISWPSRAQAEEAIWVNSSVGHYFGICGSGRGPGALMHTSAVMWIDELLS